MTQQAADTRAIWQAGVDAVRSESLVRNSIRATETELEICGHQFPLRGGRIEIVGGGKAGAGMAAGTLEALGPVSDQMEISGWVNVPADCVTTLPCVTLHPARPAGLNEPTEAGVEGTREILRRLNSLGSTDMALVLISGGGSALLPGPVPQISLADKQRVTRVLAAGGAAINELNAVRTMLSEVKGGRLIQNCQAEHVVALIISDVIGDPLDIIASGPTTPSSATSTAALQVLARYDGDRSRISSAVYDFLESQNVASDEAPPRVTNLIIGSNAIALSAATARAEELGYQVVSLGSENSGDVREHADRLLHTMDAASCEGPVCVLAGGETTVQLTDTDEPRSGGRNQELILYAASQRPDASAWTGRCLLSGGTDGEDGPTDAAGAFLDEEIAERITGLSPDSFLAINDSHTWCDQVGALIRTGPTHTNVMDIAVGVVDGR